MDRVKRYRLVYMMQHVAQSSFLYQLFIIALVKMSLARKGVDGCVHNIVTICRPDDVSFLCEAWARTPAAAHGVVFGHSAAAPPPF